MYKISVIIPVYNGEKYLAKCLESILKQTLKDIQIICINDGSIDNTLSILNKYALKDKRIEIVSSENKGQGSARNIGLTKVKGEYVFFVDADDWISKNALELLYNKAKTTDNDIIFFQMINYMNNSNNFVETDLYNHECFIKNFKDENVIFNCNDTKNFLFEIPVCPVSKLYKKEFLDLNNLKFPEGINFEDNVFFYNAFFKCEKAGFLKEHLYFRRRHDGSVTQTLDESKFDIIKATNKVLDMFIELDQYELYKKDLINHTFSMILEWFNKSPLELKDEFYNLIKRDFKGFNELKLDFQDNLNEDYSLIYDISDSNNYYLDFLSEYTLLTTEYEIYDNGLVYSKDSEEYKEYKSNLSNNYKISVIIPIYNNEKFIHRTLMSIENQSFGLENIEVLMVNDASEDNTNEVINDYANKYDGFKAIHIKKRTGSPGTPRNIGLLEASSDYVIFLDHDDLFEITALETLYNSISKEDCDFVYGTYVSVDGGSPTKIIYPKEHHGYFKNLYENQRSIAFPPPSIWTKLFKKSLLLDNKILFPTILSEDAIFVSKALFNSCGINYMWDSLICYHDLSKQSHTKNVSFNYLLEGFVSEEYMFNIYNDFEKTYDGIQSKGSFNDDENMLYKIRGEGILDFYLMQFTRSNLNINEMERIFPLLYNFVKRMDTFGLKPHVSESNEILFNYILEKDFYSILEFKGLNRGNISKKEKIKSIVMKMKKII